MLRFSLISLSYGAGCQPSAWRRPVGLGRRTLPADSAFQALSRAWGPTEWEKGSRREKERERERERDLQPLHPNDKSQGGRGTLKFPWRVGLNTPATPANAARNEPVRVQVGHRTPPRSQSTAAAWPFCKTYRKSHLFLEGSWPPNTYGSRKVFSTVSFLPPPMVLG